MVIFPLLFLRSLLHSPFHLFLSFLFIPFLYCLSYSFPGHFSIIILKENRGPNISLTDLVGHQNQTTFKIAVTAFLLWSVPLVPWHYHFRVESQLERAQYMEHVFFWVPSSWCVYYWNAGFLFRISSHFRTNTDPETVTPKWDLSFVFSNIPESEVRGLLPDFKRLDFNL